MVLEVVSVYLISNFLPQNELFKSKTLNASEIIVSAWLHSFARVSHSMHETVRAVLSTLSRGGTSSSLDFCLFSARFCQTSQSLYQGFNMIDKRRGLSHSECETSYSINLVTSLMTYVLSDQTSRIMKSTSSVAVCYQEPIPGATQVFFSKNIYKKWNKNCLSSMIRTSTQTQSIIHAEILK